MLSDDATKLLAVKRLTVYLRDERGNESAVMTDAMDDETAEAERTRIENEHASTGTGENRWIRVGDDSVQSKHIARIRLDDASPREPEVWGDPDITRDMDF